MGNSAFRLLFRVPIVSNLYGRAVYHAPKAGLAFSMEGGVTAGTVLAKVPQDETTLQMSDRTIDIACAPAVWPFTDALQAPLWERPILEIPCPWRAHQTNPANMVPPRLVSVLKRIVRSDDREVAFLHAGCGDGILLGQLRPIVRWALAGIEPDAQAGSVARGKGFEIWDTEVTDAPLILPVGRSFDVIFLDPATVRVAGLLTTLRRLRQLLKPGGSLVVTGVNLDSRLLELFGPTWHGWQVAWSMPLAGRRGMAHQAAQADLRLARFRTFTDPALTSSAVQQHRLKLVATPAPEAPSKPDKDRADNLCGWARLLWNWRGKGDTYYAVLQP